MKSDTKRRGKELKKLDFRRNLNSEIRQNWMVYELKFKKTDSLNISKECIEKKKRQQQKQSALEWKDKLEKQKRNKKVSKNTNGQRKKPSCEKVIVVDK